jgi:ribosome maturation factor RimP
MIEQKHIQNIVEDIIKDSDLFIIDISVSPSNIIIVIIDSMKGVAIDKCISISKEIESKLDRDVEDFELKVSSAGIGQPFTVIQQYHKNIGNDVEVLCAEGKKHKGILTKVTDDGFEIEYEVKEKVEGKKKKVLVKKTDFFTFDSIKYIKDIISF